jgi:hypothetical protein
LIIHPTALLNLRIDISPLMARRTSTTQLAELNAGLLSQNQQLAGTMRVAQEALGTQGNIQNELYRQRGVIEDNIDKVLFLPLRTRTSRRSWRRPTRRPMRCEDATFAPN